MRGFFCVFQKPDFFRLSNSRRCVGSWQLEATTDSIKKGKIWNMQAKISLDINFFMAIFVLLTYETL